MLGREEPVLSQESLKQEQSCSLGPAVQLSASCTLASRMPFCKQCDHQADSLVEFSPLGSYEPITLLIEMFSVIGLVDSVPVSLYINNKKWLYLI